MTDYNNTFGGAAKDAADATVLGAEHDTQFDAIASMSATKADKVAGATAGNLAELNANGELVDSGIASVPLDGLTGVVETRIDALETSQASLTPSAEVANHVRAWGMQLPDGSDAPTFVDVDANFTEGAFETLGPTGSGATNIYDELDVVPSTARALLFQIVVSINVGAGLGGVSVYGAVGGVTGAINDSNVKAHLNADAASGEDFETFTQVMIPCDSNQVCQLAWDATGGATANRVWLWYKGFIEDLS